MIRRRGYVGVFALLAVLALALGCETKPPKFAVGDVCVVKLTGERVMLVNIYGRSGSRYVCRIGGGRQQRRDGVVSADSEIVAYTFVRFFGFELREEAGR